MSRWDHRKVSGPSDVRVCLLVHIMISAILYDWVTSRHTSAEHNIITQE